jgi:hypothetical protein
LRCGAGTVTFVCVFVFEREYYSSTKSKKYTCNNITAKKR